MKSRIMGKILIALLVLVLASTSLVSAGHHLKINDVVQSTGMDVPGYVLKLDYDYSQKVINGDIKVDGVKYVYVDGSLKVDKNCFSLCFNNHGVLLHMSWVVRPSTYSNRLHVCGVWFSDDLGFKGFFDIQGVLS